MNEPNRPDFATALGLHQQGRLLEAARVYTDIAAADPAHVPALIHLGALRLQQTRPDDAEALLRRAVDQDPSSAAAHSNLGAALQSLGRVDEAIVSHETAARLAPDSAEFWYGLATALQDANRHEDAIAAYEHMAALQPDQPEGAYGIASAYQALKRWKAALPHYDRALELDPGFAEAHYGKATALQRRGRHDDSVPHFEAALAIDPAYGDAHHGIAISLQALDRCPEALEHLDHALLADPASGERHFRRGDALSRLDRPKDAEAAYRKALDLAPERVEAMLGLAGAQQAQNHDADVLGLYEQARALEPDNALVLTLLAAALLPLDRHVEAQGLLDRALELEPKLAMAHGGLGNLREQMGDLTGARNAFAEAVRLAPRRPAFYAGLFNTGRLQAGDPLIAALQALAHDGRTLTNQEQIVRLFALAKAYDDTGEKARTFDCLLEANAMKRRGIDYDEPRMMEAQRRVKRRMTGPAMRAAGRGDPSAVPIFILGMPRSGSTLAEQILASHPLVVAGGERRDFGVAMRAVAPSVRGEYRFQVSDSAALQRLARVYLDRLPALPPGKTRITDKMLGNYRVTGLIHLALPNAKIIHTRRDAVDTCLSCFSKLFSDDLNYTYELGELGRFHRAYEDMMEHWREVLPPETILDVQYEDVVDDLEGQARRLLEYCGLPWDDACLSFHETQRVVRTASVAQVRQPIYRRSVGKWRPDEALLRPLLDGLAGTR